MPSTCDVAIVGYGPVGQTLAILLGQRGWAVEVFEKQPAPYPLPRAVHFDHEIGRIMQAAGVADALAAITEPAYTYEWRNAAGATLLRFGRRTASLSGWPESNMFAQPDLEQLLDARVRTLPSVAVHRGAEVIGVRADDGGVALDIAHHSGDRGQARARYVIGCDGAKSFVRQQLGATVTDLGFFFDWLIVDLLPAEPRIWDPINLQICDPVRPTTLVSGGPGRRRWEFMRLPGESIEALNSEATAWRLLEPWGMTPATAQLERHAVYTFQARWVDTWRRGRLLLAGDAAHQMPPFAGQGMCSGIRDAANLAWKLDLVLAERAADALLDTYTSERQPQVEAMIQFSIALGRVICVADPVEAAARDAGMIEAMQATGRSLPVPPPALGPGVFLDNDPHAAQLFLQDQVRCGTAVGRFDDVVGGGWTLLSPHADPIRYLDGALAAYFRSLGGIGVHVGADAPVVDVNGVYAQWFATTGAAAVLQRPDGYVFGTAPALDGTAGIVAALRSKLAAPRHG